MAAVPAALLRDDQRGRKYDHRALGEGRGRHQLHDRLLPDLSEGRPSYPRPSPGRDAGPSGPPWPNTIPEMGIERRQGTRKRPFRREETQPWSGSAWARPSSKFHGSPSGPGLSVGTGVGSTRPRPRRRSAARSSSGSRCSTRPKGYGFGAAERLLGDALWARARREDVLVATKGGLR